MLEQVERVHARVFRRLAREREQVAVDLVERGKSYRQVGELLGVSPANVHRWVQRQRHLEAATLGEEKAHQVVEEVPNK